MDTSEQFHTNKTAMKRIVAIFSSGDMSQLDVVIAPDYLDHQGLGGGAMHGQAGFRQVVMVARAALPHLQVAIHDLIAEDDKVVAQLQWHSRDAAGKTIDRETIEILRFRDGQAVEHWGAEAWTMEHNPRVKPA